MSKRRQAGEWVWLKPHSGFTGQSHLLKVEVMPESTPAEPCFCNSDCHDDECREWLEVMTEPDPSNSGTRYILCHVSECEMLDEKWEDE